MANGSHLERSEAPRLTGSAVGLAFLVSEENHEETI